ncbi:MAG: type IV pilus biogenesis/stability protein PilW [Leptothrix sp. (in: Bacteria)]|nr:type IV pilus biogenesis/stability protein PilW [Leptothrix sp. (in: b-proteobacteria)]
MTRRLLAGVTAWLAVLLLAGCVSTTTGGPARVEPDPADADKRARVRLELAGLYLGRGQTETALGEVDRAIAAKADLPEAYNLRGLIYATQGNLAQAEQSFQRALQLAPGNGDVMHNYGWFLCQQRRWADADAQFSAALALPQYRDAMRTLLAQGVCQARAGHWADAERTLSRSYELDPGNPVTAYNLSEVLMRRGELERARFYIARINSQPELSSAQSLWLAVRIERRLGNLQAVQDFGRKLQERYPESNEVLLYERGRFDD